MAELKTPHLRRGKARALELPEQQPDPRQLDLLEQLGGARSRALTDDEVADALERKEGRHG